MEPGDSASYIADNGSSWIQRADKTWGVGGAELTDAIKTRLGSEGLEQYYPYVYYNLNLIGALRSEVTSIPSSRPSDELIIPDASMQETTKDQIARVAQLYEAMDAIIHFDATMSHHLTVFSNLPAHAIPDTFILSRKNVAQLEAKMRDIAEGIFAASGIYTPVGSHNKSGRSWPYMDPNAQTDEEQYGRELDALRQENIAPASYELQRELKEIRARRERVDRGERLLERLHRLERA